MADQQARQDWNDVPALIAHTGTAGTAETVRVTADASGNLGVNIVTGEIVASLGTVKLVESGTIKEVTGVSNLVTGTLATLGTVGVLNDGTVEINAGTITTQLAGTQELLGTVNHVGTVGVNKNYGYNGTNWHENRIDSSTRAINTIDHVHHEMHDGLHFFIDGFATIGSGVSKTFTVVTPDTTKWSHMYFDVQSTDQTEMLIYEDSSLGTGGTATTPINSNRNSAGTSVLTIKEDQVVGTVGVLLSSQSFGATDNPAKTIGGALARENEVILKQGGTYAFRFTSRAAGNIVSYRGNWYEHTNQAS